MSQSQTDAEQPGMGSHHLYLWPLLWCPGILLLDRFSPFSSGFSSAFKWLFSWGAGPDPALCVLENFRKKKYTHRQLESLLQDWLKRRKKNIFTTPVTSEWNRKPFESINKLSSLTLLGSCLFYFYSNFYYYWFYYHSRRDLPSSLFISFSKHSNYSWLLQFP